MLIFCIWVGICRKAETATGGVLQIGVLKSFAKLTGKHLCQGLFFNQVAGFRPATLLKTDFGTDVFL